MRVKTKFCNKFKETYGLHANLDQKRKEFYDLKFEIGKSQSFHDYVWLVHRKIKDISPNAIFDDIRDRIENSVPYVIRNAILSCRPINEVELIKVGSRVERDLIIKARNNRKAFVPILLIHFDIILVCWIF